MRRTTQWQQVAANTPRHASGVIWTRAPAPRPAGRAASVNPTLLELPIWGEHGLIELHPHRRHLINCYPPDTSRLGSVWWVSDIGRLTGRGRPDLGRGGRPKTRSNLSEGSDFDGALCRSPSCGHTPLRNAGRSMPKAGHIRSTSRKLGRILVEIGRDRGRAKFGPILPTSTDT